MKKLILASASPRRRELLEQIGLDAEVIIGHADESAEIEQPDILVKELAKRKCSAVFGFLSGKTDERHEYYILGADTVVVHNGTILGKPKDRQDAVKMLRSLQGSTHQVYTGVCIVHAAGKESFPESDPKHIRLFSVCTDVSVDSMTESEIGAYVNSGEPMDKAGAYGIQGLFARHIGGIRGEYTNVVGLPVSAVYRALRELHYYE